MKDDKPGDLPSNVLLFRKRAPERPVTKDLMAPYDDAKAIIERMGVEDALRVAEYICIQSAWNLCTNPMPTAIACPFIDQGTRIQTLQKIAAMWLRDRPAFEAFEKKYAAELLKQGKAAKARKPRSKRVG